MSLSFPSFSSRESSLDPSSEGLLSWSVPYNEPRSEGYDEYFDPPLESKYECPICLLGLRLPVQTSCGHRFCRGCILRSIRDAGPKCPVDNEPLVESQLYPDNFAKREMMALNIFCRLSKERGCPWKGPLGSLEDHLKECQFVDVDCPNECDAKLRRKDLGAHMEKDCPFRKIPCQYCQLPVLWSELQSHVAACPKYPLECEKCHEDGILREKLDEHLKKYCPQVEIKCPFIIVGCQFKGLRTEVNRHVKEQLQSHVMDLAEKVKTLMPSCSEPGAEEQGVAARTRNGFESEPREQFSEEGFMGAMTVVTANCSNQQREVDRLRQLVTDQAAMLDHLDRRLEDSRGRHERQIQDLSLRLSRYETKLSEFEGRVCNGSYIWRIENYRQCRQDAIRGITTAIHSPPFHTSLYGYKLCMRVNLNGVDSGVNRHIALFVHMMQGDYDDILDWPFTGRIALSILDQRDGVEFRHHISETLVAKPNLLAFQRPTSARNYKGYGYVEFAPIEQICEPQYVKNNVMLVRIQLFP